jgi:hypothetical protein
LHIVTTILVWDRYVLPLAPWLALVASGPLAMTLHRRLPDWMRGLLLLLLVVGIVELVPPALQASRGQMPIGGDHGDYAGLTKAIAWVQAQCDAPQPGATGTVADKATDKACPAILYHQVLGWHLRFYLFDELQAEGLQAEGNVPPRFDLRWFPSAVYLADNAAKSPYPPKYLIVPDWATPRDLALHLAMRGMTLETRVRAGRFAVVEIIQPPRPVCDWCKSSSTFTVNPFIVKPHALPVAPQMSTP